jgi:hypothetical protein
MPNQNNSNQNPNSVNPVANADKPVAINPPTNPPPSKNVSTPPAANTSFVPPVISPQADLPPLPPEFQNTQKPASETPGPASIPTTAEVTPPLVTTTPTDTTSTQSEGSAAPPDIPTITTGHKKKFGTGKIIATILGLFLLIGGVGAGVILTQQQQLFQQKAKTCECSDAYGDYCQIGYHCSNTTCGTCIPNSTPAPTQPPGCGSNPPCPAGFYCRGGNCVPNATTPPTNPTTTPQSTCTGKVNLVSSNTNSSSITVTQAMYNECLRVCSSGTLYAAEYKCDSNTTSGGCNQNGTMINSVSVGQTISMPAPTCGTVQIDIGCKNPANTYGTVAFVSQAASTSCSTPPPPPTNPTTPPTAPFCSAITMYTSDWVLIPHTSSIQANEPVYFCATGGAFSKVTFTIKVNGSAVANAPIVVRPGSTDLCEQYTVKPGDQSFSISATVY